MRTATTTLALAALAASAGAAHATPCVHGTTPPPNGTCFDTYQRPDGRVETYYAATGSRLALALALLSDRWDSIGAAGDWHPYDDDLPYLPEELSALRHNGAITVARSLESSLVQSAQGPVVGLAPAYALTTWQYISRPLGFGALLAWPGSPAFRDAALANALATQQYFGGGVPGFIPWVSKSGSAEQAWDVCPIAVLPDGRDAHRTILASIGHAMRGMIEIAIATGRTDLGTWVDAKLAFIDANGTGAYPQQLVPDKWTEVGTCLDEGPSSDNNYFARALYAAADAIAAAPAATAQALAPLRGRMLEHANNMAVGWATLAFLPAEQRFATHMRFDGHPYDTTTLGDTKWNILYLIADSVRHQPGRSVTDLDLARRHWETLRATAKSGLVDEDYGTDSHVIEPDAPALADALMELHRAAQGVTLPAGMSPTYFRTAALSLFDGIVAHHGEAGTRRRVLDNGSSLDSAFMTRVALGEFTHHRLAIDAAAAGRPFTIRSCASPQFCLFTVLGATLPPYSRLAIALLPEGLYRVTVGGTSQLVSLTTDQSVTF